MSVDSASPEADVEATPDAVARPRRHALDVVLGVAGEILIAAGVLLALFVVWELFYTDVQADREQEQIIDDLGWAAPVTAGLPAAGDDPVEAPEVVPVIPDELKQTGPQPNPMAEPANATTFAAMYVPRWGDDYRKPIAQGVGRRDVLDRLGIGHYPGTAMPGEVGNFAVAGHRVTHGKPFHAVEDLELGDAVIVQTEDYWYVYAVTSTEIVWPGQVEVIAPVPGEPVGTPDTAFITMTTCHPMYSAAKRFIVHGELQYWAPTGNGYPSEMVEDLA